jgi:hypothetical protein
VDMYCGLANKLNAFQFKNWRWPLWLPSIFNQHFLYCYTCVQLYKAVKCHKFESLVQHELLIT